MTFDEYQKLAARTDYEVIESVGAVHFTAILLGLVGEAGEVAEKFKKIYRDKNCEMSEDDRQSLKKELGDVLWYISSISRHLDLKLEDVAQTNLDKLQDRQKRNAINGAGDNR